MMLRDFCIQNESGVSETVGFIIIMGIVLTGIGLVTLYGYPALLDAQADANVKNMERNFISLQSDVNSMSYKNIPYKETSVQVSGGVLSVKPPDRNNAYLTINSDGAPLLSYLPNNEFLPGSLRFLSESGEISIGLENGAVVKRQTGGSVLLSEPRWFVDTNPITGEEIFVINLIQIAPEDPTKPLAKSGISTVQMTVIPLMINPGVNPGSDDDTNVIDKSVPGGQQIEIGYGIPSEYYKAWTNYFQHSLQMTESGGYWTKEVDRVIIKAWTIEVHNI